MVSPVTTLSQPLMVAALTPKGGRLTPWGVARQVGATAHPRGRSSSVASTVDADARTVRPARVAERNALEALQRRASMHEPMYRAQLAAHPDAIQLPPDQITAGHVRVAEQNGVVVGFAVLLER